METAPGLNPTSLPPGTVLGSWRIVGVGAHGSHGVVYRAERIGHPEAGSFALKLALTPMDPRFDHEAELLSRIDHPNVPRLHGRGVWAGPGGAQFPYLVMDWVKGLPLYAWARVHALTSREQLRLLSQVARALAATHAAGGVHRDVKGENILVKPQDGQAVLTDFGSCHYRGASTLTRQLPPPSTPQYASPESQRFQWRWRHRDSARYEATPADDVYALGMTAYRLATGRYPPNETEAELSAASDDVSLIFPPLVPPERLVRLSPELARLIRQMLSDAPADRGSMAEVAYALEHAARTAKRQADQPVTPITSGSSAALEEASGPGWFSPVWRVGLMVAAASVALVCSTWALTKMLTPEAPGAVVAANLPERSAGGKDAATAELGEAALAERVETAAPERERGGISRDMPKDPLPGQRRPPCEFPEVELRNGCWWLLGNATPPCGKRGYAWKNKCYLPSYEPPRPSTSGQE